MITSWITRKQLAMAALCGLLASVGCQQKMADQPYQRAMSENSLLENKQSARPLDDASVHRNQYLSNDPLVTWLTEAGKNVKLEGDLLEKWKAEVDPSGKTVPPPGAPTSKDNFVKEFPFQLTHDDFERGEYLYRTICSHCHGGAGHANGKIHERGFLRPPSFHTDPEGKAKDWSTLLVNPKTQEVSKAYNGNKQGTSRGFYRYGVEIELKEVPVGYIVQVITWGYGGMAAHSTQIPDFADRWRVAAHIRALQLSQAAPASTVGDIDKKIAESNKKPKADKAEGSH